MSNSNSSSTGYSDIINTENGLKLVPLRSKHLCMDLNCESTLHNQTNWSIFDENDLEIFTSLLEDGIDISQLEINSQSLFDISIEKNNEDLVKLLLNKDVPVWRDINELICNTIKKGNKAIVKHLLDYGFQKNSKINVKDCFDAAIDGKYLDIIELLLTFYPVKKSFGMSILKSVVLKDGLKYKECVEFLLERGFSIDNRFKSHDFAFSAVQNGHIIIVEQLLKLGINVNLVNKKTKLTLLHVAVLHNYVDIVQILIRCNADVNWIIMKRKWLGKDKKEFEKIVNLGGKTALHIAVDNSNLQMTKLLLDNGAKIIDDLNFVNITCNAIRKGSLEIVKLFLEYGVQIDYIDAAGRNFLHICATCKFQPSNIGCEIAEFLLREGIDINGETPEKNTPIFDAIINNNTELVKIFLKYNANIQHVNVEGDTPLHKAVGSMIDEEIVKTLLNHNVQVNIANKKSCTPLHVACQQDTEENLEVIEKLVLFNANIHCLDRNNKTPLHYACDKGHVLITQLLLNHGAIVDVIDSDGNTPLHLGCKNKNLQIVEDLIKYKANSNIKNNCSQTPLLTISDNLEEWLPGTIEWLTQNGKTCESLNIVIETQKKYSKIIQLLLENRADINAVDKEGKSSLHIAAEKNYDMVVKILLKFNIDLNIIDNKGQSALHYAAENGNSSIVKSLLMHGANVNIISNLKKTALHYASIRIIQKQKMLKNYLKGSEKKVDVSQDCKDKYTKSYQEEINSYKNVIKILKEHVIKLKCAKLNVDFKNITLAYDETTSLSTLEFNPHKFQSCCEEEITLLMSTKIKGSDISLYELLTQDIFVLTRYANDKNIMKALLSDANRKMFPLYIDIITFRFMAGAQRYDLIEIAKKYSLPTLFQGLSCNYANEVLSYFDVDELKQFIEMIKRVFSIECQSSSNK